MLLSSSPSSPVEYFSTSDMSSYVNQVFNNKLVMPLCLNDFDKKRIFGDTTINHNIKDVVHK